MPLAGKPLISWTIEAAKKSKYINSIVVTSDDAEILSIAKKLGCECVLRPNELAQDDSASFDAVKHAIENSQQHEFVVLLQPTSPLRTDRHIDEAINLLESKEADAVVSVTKMEHSPLWANTLPKDMSMVGFMREDILNLRSQDLPSYYRLNGAIYICKVDKLIERGSFFLKQNIFAYVMSAESSSDIDNKIDFDFADFLLKD